MEKSRVHVLISRRWFDDMFILKDAKQRKLETYEAFEAYAASMEIVIKFTSGLTLDDGFEFVYPRWVTDSDKQEYADKFAYMVENSAEFIVRDGHMYVDPFRMHAVSIRTPFVVNQPRESIVYLESVYRKIVDNNPDISNRYKDNLAVFAYMLTDEHNGSMYNLMNKSNTNDYIKNIDSTLFVDASSKVKDLMNKYSKNKTKESFNKNTYDVGIFASQNDEVYMKSKLSKIFDGWRSEFTNDGTSGYLNVERAADNANRTSDNE